MFHICKTIQQKLGSLTPIVCGRTIFHKSPAQETAKLGTIACQYEIICLSAYQYQIILCYPKQSTLDVAGRNCNQDEENPV
jgi:hypothetical protein